MPISTAIKSFVRGQDTDRVPSRNASIARLRSTQQFDVLIIGGGSTGAGAALGRFLLCFSLARTAPFSKIYNYLFIIMLALSRCCDSVRIRIFQLLFSYVSNLFAYFRGSFCSGLSTVCVERYDFGMNSPVSSDECSLLDLMIFLCTYSGYRQWYKLSFHQGIHNISCFEA
jgi:hypothetical protein